MACRTLERELRISPLCVYQDAATGLSCGAANSLLAESVQWASADLSL